MKNYLIIASILMLSQVAFSQATIYVNPGITHNNSATGTQMDPYGDISTAVQDVFEGGGGEVLLLAGTYELTRQVSIVTPATESTAVIIKPETGAYVKFNFGIRSAFFFQESASYITLEGVEIDGNTNETDFWCTVAEDLWSDDGNPDGGGLAVILDGQHLTIRNNYIHDCYQKGVEIRSGRYLVIEGNIIQSIANTSLSGGHGIMRQQVGKEFFDDDLENVYRWDIRGNMLFNVEQRIYSWVPRKGFMEMVIDEGKSILIDDPKDSDGSQERMSARIINNVVAFGAVDHIRLKSTPNLEVSNNSIYSEGANADGISDKGGDTPTPQFTNFICKNNASQTVANVSAIEIDKCVQETTDAGGTPIVLNNYAMDGRIKPRNQAGLNRLSGGQLFVNPNAGNFTINPSLNFPNGVGVDPAVLADLNQRAMDFGVSIGWDGWITDHLKLSQTILDNIPGVNDGILDNETVFTDAGIINPEHSHIDYDVVDGAWKTARRAQDTMRFELNPVYEAWYSGIATTCLNESGDEYERIRWGDSEVKQDQAFDPDWLTVSEVSNSSVTLINGYDNNFILDGDLLVNFVGYTPTVNETFTLMTAGTITTANAGDLFDNVKFDGFTPEDYRLEIVSIPGGGQALELTILEEILPVTWRSFEGEVVSKTAHLLNWETAAEITNAFFEIERSSDGSTWEVIGKVLAASNAEGENTYEFTDTAPLLGANFYRLRQVDLDGTFSFSEVLQLVSEQVSVLRGVYPNPFTDQFVIPIEATGKQLSISDVDGRDITREVELDVEEDRIIVKTPRLPAGSYLVSYDGKAAIIIKK